MGPALFSPGAPGRFDETAVKDPSIVFHGGRWHLFYTARGQGRYSLGYASAETMEGLQGARRHPLPQLSSGQTPYAAAPQVFYFRPQRRWYLIYQTTEANYQPVFSTAKRVDQPSEWTRPRPLMVKRDAAKWIDFWVICDERFAYLFFTRDHKELYFARTRLERFPEGWGEPRRAFGPQHESAHVYQAAGTEKKYILLFETQEGDLRSFGLAEAGSLDGPWREVERRFAPGAGLSFTAERWTAEVSHGELIRSGYDERLEADARHFRFLIQGLPAGEHRGPYPELRWRLGVISAELP